MPLKMILRISATRFTDIHADISSAVFYDSTAAYSADISVIRSIDIGTVLSGDIPSGLPSVNQGWRRIFTFFAILFFS